jgi:hypothetical protein
MLAPFVGHKIQAVPVISETYKIMGRFLEAYPQVFTKPEDN